MYYSILEQRWLQKVQTALWDTFEGAYIDFETLPDRVICQYLRLQQYTIEKAVQVIIRHNRISTRRCLCGKPAGSFGYCIDCEKDLEEAYREEQER